MTASSLTSNFKPRGRKEKPGKEEDLEEAESKGLNIQDIPEDKSEKLKNLFGNFFVKSCGSLENSNCCLMLSLLDFVFGIY